VENDLFSYLFLPVINICPLIWRSATLKSPPKNFELMVVDWVFYSLKGSHSGILTRQTATEYKTLFTIDGNDL
jgi:hypothetical protein